MTEQTLDVLIIGAGASGLAAGSRLLENGITNFQIIEAENRIGGRINSVEFGEYMIDLGAQWCHGEDGNIVYQMANPLGLLDHSQRNFITNQQFHVPFGRVLDDQMCRRVLDYLDEVADDVPSYEDRDQIKPFTSCGEYYREHLHNALESGKLSDVDSRTAQLVFKWFDQYVSHYDGCDNWFAESMRDNLKFEICDGDQNSNWKNKTYSTFLDALFLTNEQLTNKIRLNVNVTHVKWDHDDDLVRVQCDNRTFLAKQVIVTVSLGVLKHEHDLFVPQLPSWKREAIESMHIGCVNKIFLKYQTKWWPDECYGFNFTCPDEDAEEFLGKFLGTKEQNQWLLGVLGFYVIDHRPNILLGWIQGDAARQMEMVPEAEVKEKVGQLLEIYLGSVYDVPELEDFTYSKWSSNRHFRGSYSSVTLTAEAKNITQEHLQRPISNENGKRVIFFAGEHTHSRFFSTVHGAVESGFREADNILLG